MNPFDDQYTIDEIAWYGITSAELNGITIKSAPLVGRCDELLNKRFWVNEFDVPMFFIDGSLWMSLTAMEVQAAYLPLCYSHGIVGTGGLGMGYYPLRCAEIDEVEKVIVYEINPKVIEFYNHFQKDRKFFDKIQIIQQDVRTVEGQEFDFFYNDIYKDQLPDEVIDDAARFMGRNEVHHYHFFAQERVLFQALNNRYELSLSIQEGMFFSNFIEATYADGKYRKADLYNDIYGNEEFIEEVLDVLDKM